MAMITTVAAPLAVAVIALLLLPVGGRGEEEERPTAAHPHGLPFESPLALSPAAYDFFHPSNARTRRAAHHSVAPAPALAPRGQQQQLRESAVRGTSSAGVAKADQEEGAAAVAPVETHRRNNRTVTGVFVGAAAAALVAVAVAYVVVRRRVVVARGGAAAAATAPKSTA